MTWRWSELPGPHWAGATARAGRGAAGALAGRDPAHPADIAVSPDMGDLSASPPAENHLGTIAIQASPLDVKGPDRMFFDSRWNGRIRGGLLLVSLLVMAIAGSAGGRWT